MVSARSVKIGPSVLLADNSAPVVGSTFTITPEPGEAIGIVESAVAMLALNTASATAMAVLRRPFRVGATVVVVKHPGVTLPPQAVPVTVKIFGRAFIRVNGAPGDGGVTVMLLTA